MIHLCKANGDQAELPAIRDAFRATGLPVSDSQVYQLTCADNPDFSPAHPAWRQRTREGAENAIRLGRDDAPAYAFLNWEYPGHISDPMTPSQLNYARQLMHPFRSQGVGVAFWGRPFVHTRDETWTSERALRLADQMAEIADYIIINLVPRAGFYSQYDRHRYVAICGHATRVLTARTGKPVFGNFQTFIRPQGIHRQSLSVDDAHTIGVAMRAVHDAGGVPFIWTEEVGGSYAHQYAALASVGAEISRGWGVGDLSIQADAGGPQGVNQ